MQNARPLKSKVSITLDDEVIQQIRSWSIEEDNSFSRYINRVLKQHIEQKRKSQKNKTPGIVPGVLFFDA